jgi:uncharacterized protein (DUF305 family)/uncharacterized cupredoxin-like copper-binding protein
MQAHLRRLLIAVAILAIAGATAVLGTTQGDSLSVRADDAHHAKTQTAEATHGRMAQDTAGTPMPGMNMPQDFDLMFIDMMIPHHQGAIAMAKVALTEGEHQEIRDLARAIIKSQQSEIDQLQTWRDEWYPDVPEMPMDQVSQIMGQMPSMMATPNAGMLDMTSIMEHMGDPAAGAEALRSVTGPFDQAFIEMMVPHHQSAVAMAAVALGEARHPEITELAEAIIEDQQREIGQMQAWLEEWYGATPEAGTPSAYQVDVTLTEFAIASSQTTFEANHPYQFTVTNVGAIPHEFMIMPRVEGIGQMDMETLDDLALAMIPIEDLPPGALQTIEVTFNVPIETGALEFVCAAPAHYDAGMNLVVSVNG